MKRIKKLIDIISLQYIYLASVEAVSRRRRAEIPFLWRICFLHASSHTASLGHKICRHRSGDIC